jgi:predicted Zn finger-like uncharacterized protein
LIMIIQCENCLTKYNLDESLLNEGGSKVRCSRCKHTFVAYPSEPVLGDLDETDFSLEDEFEETVALDSPPILRNESSGPGLDESEIDFDKVFEESLEDQELFRHEAREDLSAPERVGQEGSEGEAFPGLTGGAEEDHREEEPEIGGEPDLFEAPFRPEPTRSRGKSRILVGILVIILILLGGAAAVIFYAPELLPDSLGILKPAKKTTVTDIGVRRLSFKDVTGSFVKSQKAGSLFVIRGLVLNDYPKSRSFILVRGSILDDKGQAVMKQVAYAGNTYTEMELQNLSTEELDKAMKNRSGMNNSNVNVAPESSVPFMIVFESLPDNLSEFTVEAASSSPGA